MTNPQTKVAFRPTLCLDFDGVIHSYSSGWKGVGVIPDPPVDGATDFIMDALRKFDVAIYSSRSKSLRGRWAMKRWLYRYLVDWEWQDAEDRWQELNNIPPNWNSGPFTHGSVDGVHRELANATVKKIKWPWFKPAAWVTLDDRAIQFDGLWPDLEEIMAFKPWNKR